MDPNRIAFLQEKATDIRCLVLESIGKLGVGHIGGSLSIVDALTVLYHEIMRLDPSNPKWEERDRFVLSKGHGGPGVYAVLADKGYFPVEWLDTLNGPDTLLPSHCDRLRTPGIDMTAGSLGQGLSAAAGMALAAKRDGKGVRVYAIIGDGESQEGQVWEAAMFARQYQLDNLTAFTDYNHQQIDGTISEVNELEPLADKWRSFGWNVMEIDGHDIEAIEAAIRLGQKQKGKPSMIILHTIKAKGAYFCEGKTASHNMPISEEQWKTAVQKLRGEE
ncbi:MAG TPA: transketolase [Thermotogota bacterium]|nr:transketolase [Thermotogota bacterium]HRW92926.1 transketolase [Thermotogota bacterium]